MKIKVNDQVKVISGKDRGKSGKVIQVFPEERRVVVEGVNKIKRHLKPRTRTDKGQILELAAPMAAGKVMLLCPKCGQLVRVGYGFEGGAKKRRCRQCQSFIE